MHTTHYHETLPERIPALKHAVGRMPEGNTQLLQCRARVQSLRPMPEGMDGLLVVALEEHLALAPHVPEPMLGDIRRNLSRAPSWGTTQHRTALCWQTRSSSCAPPGQ